MARNSSASGPRQCFWILRDTGTADHWYRNSRGTHKADWSLIQPRLGFYQEVHFLVLLDCCFGAQAARTVRKRMVPHNVELVAACAMGVKTTCPGPRSFTSILIDELRSLFNESRLARISDVVNGLASRFDSPRESPVRYCGPSIPRGTVYLEQIPAKLGNQTKRERAFITLKIALCDDLSDSLEEEMIRWLRNLAPRKVTKLTVEEVIVSTEKAHHYIFDADRGSSSTSFQQLSLAGKDEIMRAWHGLSTQLTTIGTQLKRSSAFVNQSTSPAVDVQIEQADPVPSLQDLENGVIDLHRSIERHVMALSDLYKDEKSLLAAVEDRVLQDMGFLPLLQLRLKVRFPQNLDLLEQPRDAVKCNSTPLSRFSTIFEATMSEFDSVLIEYKSYKSANSALASISTQVLNESAKHLSAILHTETTTKFCNLRCDGWFHEVDNQRFGLIFRQPDERHGIISLRDIILTADRLQRPTLEQRYFVARRVGDALLQWHTADWVHQGVASHNIIFFRENDSIDYSTPYLCGFEYSRHIGTPSTPKKIIDFEMNVYRHPSRQGIRSKFHTKRHDIYSYGVLLLEIGVWDLAMHCFEEKERDDRTRTITPLIMQRILVNNARIRLKHYMGTAYQDAACKCLTLDLGVESDNDIDSQLGFAFEDRVLKRIPFRDIADESHLT